MLINKSIHIQASPAAVWDLLTNPVVMKQWVSDAPVDITADWRTGGAIHYRGDLHGIAYENKGIILRYEPRQVLEYRFWSTLSQLPDAPENYSVITFTLTPGANTTVLHFQQTNFATEVIYQHFNFYWNTALGLIKNLAGKNK